MKANGIKNKNKKFEKSVDSESVVKEKVKSAHAQKNKGKREMMQTKPAAGTLTADKKNNNSRN